jgi:Mor family transcriptional regulator
MASKNATAILPKSLVQEIQKYVQGETLYIPKPKSAYKKWGSCSGTRQEIDQRNKAIQRAYQTGKTMEQLATEFYLSIESIKKIVYTK